ncbi:hypothetical protein HCEG_09300 [Histoplasma capsulatum var. duboisii H88]|uniref:Uncharacterized protein n=1 Tax=Ajellomyces capsulatus (strain H88) TaxID=544711 RepID=F0UW08_AJEC8|nr:hypothetical protein HCEG_09300 [Histoplasma capsulatum var. duboisii H88]
MDVEHLIALLTEVDPQNELPRRAKIPLEDPLHDRLRIVLDAIASTSNKPVQHACENIIDFFQTGINNKTLEHTRELISDLKALGDDFTEYRQNVEQETQIKSQESELSRADSPEIDESKFPSHLRQKVHDFRAKVFLFTLPKIHQRLHKRYKPTRSSRGFTFVNLTNELDVDSNDSAKILWDASRIINWMLYNLPKNSKLFPDDKTHLLVKGLRRLAGLVRRLFQMETWLSDFAKIPSKIRRFPLEEFLKKLSSISNNTDTLLKYAYSPRLYQKYIINTNIEVARLGNGQREIQLPSHDQWPFIAEKILVAQGATSLLSDISKDIQKIPGFRLQTSFPGNIVQGKIHCECKLVLHLIETSCLGLLALPYIGVSKLSCLACWEFLSSLCKIDHIFYVKGSHSKAYFPWKFPDVEMDNARIRQEERDQVLNSFYSSLAGTYKRRLEAEERLRKMSDSTVGSDEGINSDEDSSLDEFDMPRNP